MIKRSSGLGLDAFSFEVIELFCSVRVVPDLNPCSFFRTCFVGPIYHYLSSEFISLRSGLAEHVLALAFFLLFFSLSLFVTEDDGSASWLHGSFLVILPFPCSICARCGGGVGLDRGWERDVGMVRGFLRCEVR